MTYNIIKSLSIPSTHFKSNLIDKLISEFLMIDEVCRQLSSFSHYTLGPHFVFLIL